MTRLSGFRSVEPSFMDSRPVLVATPGAHRMAVEERWVDVVEAARHLGVTRDTIYRWIDARGFPAHRAGRLLRFKLSEIDDWVRQSTDDQTGDGSDKPDPRQP